MSGRSTYLGSRKLPKFISEEVLMILVSSLTAVHAARPPQMKPSVVDNGLPGLMGARLKVAHRSPKNLPPSQQLMVNERC